jgi:hypothetical protein
LRIERANNNRTKKYGPEFKQHQLSVPRRPRQPTRQLARLCVEVPTELFESLRDYCTAHTVSMTSVVEALLRSKLEINE